MGSSFLEQLARAYMESERQRIGLPAEQMAAAKLQTEQAQAQAIPQEAAIRALKLKQAQQELDLFPQKSAAELEQTRAQTEGSRAQAEAAKALAAHRSSAPTKQIERTIDLGDRVVTVYTDGTREETAKGATPKTPGDGPAPPVGRLTPLVDGDGRIIGTFNNVTGEVGQIGDSPPGQPAQVGGVDARKSPLPAAMQQASGMAQTVKENVDLMDELADKVVAGPVTGHLSKASQAIFGPSGDEGTFDFLGDAAVDLVYIKSGKQINATEQATLRRMIPNRARGNLKTQVKLFRDYANSLLAKYGVSEQASDDFSDVQGGSSGESSLDSLRQKYDY